LSSEPPPSEPNVTAASSEPSQGKVVIPRAEHPISRKNIAEEALRVMQRLNQNGFKAYLVGGAVRDLYIGKEPKDYDIATDARPSRLKKLFRNCRIIGRRFRIAHIFFANGQILEVSTFRQSASDAQKPGDDSAQAASTETNTGTNDGSGERRQRPERRRGSGIVRAESGIILRDNEYGTPEEDARRRDLTINGLFYDLETFSVLDYVGGVDDLKSRVVRMITDPDLSFREDPVRMIRALRHAARTGFRIEAATLEAIFRNRKDILKANPSRLLEEMLKDLRGGAAAPYFASLVETHVLDSLLPVLARQLREHGPDHPFWRRMRALDESVQNGHTPTTAVLLSLLLHTTLFDDPDLWIGGAPNPPDVWKQISENLRRSTQAMRVSRRDTERISQVVIAFLKLHRDLDRGHLGKSLAHKVYLLETIDFLEIDLESQDISNPLTDKWRQHATAAHAQANAEREQARASRGERERTKGDRRGGSDRREDRDASGDSDAPRRRRRRRPRRGPR
jgi:poly(A) polymerase